MENNGSFPDQLSRIKLVTHARTHIALAEFFGVRQSALSDAVRRGQIPADWLAVLLRAKGVLPQWALTGQGPCYAASLLGRYESGNETDEADEAALKRLSTWALANELARRIAVANGVAYDAPEQDAAE